MTKMAHNRLLVAFGRCAGGVRRDRHDGEFPDDRAELLVATGRWS
jgi:hypothetical protein